MAIKAPLIAELKTFAMFQTNIQKLQYGSAAQGAGFIDKFYDYKSVRGKFEQLRGTTVIQAGDKLPINVYRFICRYEVNISNIISLQLRLVINGKPYTVINHYPIIEGRTEWLVFEIVQFKK